MSGTSVSRFLESPRSNLRDILNTPIDEVILSSYFLDNLSDKEITEFKERFKDMRIVVLLDYFKTNNSGFSARRHQESELAEYLTESILDLKDSRDGNDSKKAITPERDIASLAYLSFLRNKAKLNGLVEKSSSKDDLKRIFYIDYIYLLLSDERKRQIDYNGDNREVSEITKKVARLYKAQNFAEKIKQTNKDLESLVKEITSSDISISKISEKRKFSEHVSKFESEKYEDLEVKELVQRAKILIQQGNEAIKNKIETRFNHQYSPLENEFDFLAKKGNLNDREFDTIKKIHAETEDLFGLLNYVGDNRTKIVNKLLRDWEEIIRQYEEFKAAKPRLESYKNKLMQDIAKIKDLSFRSSFLKMLKMGSIEEILSLETSVRGIREDICGYRGNKYLQNYADSNNNLVNQFYHELKPKIEEGLKELAATEANYNNNIFSFLCKSQIRKIEKYKEALGGLGL